MRDRRNQLNQDKVHNLQKRIMDKRVGYEKKAAYLDSKIEENLIYFN